MLLLLLLPLERSGSFPYFRTVRGVLPANAVTQIHHSRRGGPISIDGAIIVIGGGQDDAEQNADVDALESDAVVNTDQIGTTGRDAAVDANDIGW